MYRCKTCGNIVVVVNDGGVNPVCCGQDMELLIPGTSDGDVEKHVPKVTKNNCKVQIDVGSIPHPMTKEHYIKIILLETDKGLYIRYLKDGDVPSVEFTLTKDEVPIMAYSYCNIHSLFGARI